jgi:hypothetical protein
LAAWSITFVTGEEQKNAAKVTTTTTTDANAVTIVSGTCTASNDFKYTECGSGLTKLCCKTREKCVGPVKPKLGADMFVCSQPRQLTGAKAVKIVILPLFGFLLDIAIIAFMAVKLNAAGNHVTKACIAVVAVSWPLFLSSFWAKGFYAAFLAVFVASMSETKDLPWWAYRLAFALIIFQVVSIFGPYESFHIPLFHQSKAANTDLIAGIQGHTEKECSKYYDNYFKVLSIEKQAKDADPDLNYNGLCTMEWIATVQVFALFQGLIWIAITFVAAPFLLKDLVENPTEVTQIRPASPPKADVPHDDMKEFCGA